MDKKPKNMFSRGLQVAHKYGIHILIKGAYTYLYQRSISYLGMILAHPRFKELSETVITKDQALDFVFSFKRYGISIHPSQSRKEISMFLSLAEKKRPRVVLEIGTCGGGTLFLFTRIATSNALLVSVDMPWHPKWRETLIKSFPMKDQTVVLVKGDSQNVDTFNRVRQSLGENSVDLLFIDGDHQYNAVKRDFELYSQLVRAGGLVAFHDIAARASEKRFESELKVYEFWNELKNKHEYIELIERKTSYGIGILLF